MPFETFSYLPPLAEEEVRAQVADLTRRGLIPAIEYTARPTARDSYWRLWKLPFVHRPSDPAEVLREVDACAAANPAAHVKLVGYDSVRQGQVVSFIVRRPREGDAGA
ncbi:MAG TPA: ribulose bisphosphate carboxylase small subunit [Gaiellales bacterium]|jgi:ribulose-bisphosphate carboxylase small chain|nr:ribulose bisphosphate carboxylase small subunit [Gaiellales bacterium]